MALFWSADDGSACGLSRPTRPIARDLSDSNPSSRPDIMSDKKPTTLYDKIWDDHLVHEADDGTCLLYIDRHLVH